MFFVGRRPLNTRNLLCALVALALSVSACSDSADTVDEAQTSGGAESTNATSEPTAVEIDSDGVGSDQSGDAEQPETNSSNDDPPSPAAEEIRELIGAQASIYDWDRTQVDCIAEGVIATGEASPGEVANDVYAGIISDCGGLRGQLEFAMALVLDRATGTCVVDAMSDDEVDALGRRVLEESYEVAEAAMAEALAAHPECG